MRQDTGPARRTPLDPPSPGEASEWLYAARQLHAATPGARHPWTPTSDRATPAGPAAEGRSCRADATTRHTIMPQRSGTLISQVSGAGRLLEPHTPGNSSTRRSSPGSTSTPTTPNTAPPSPPTTSTSPSPASYTPREPQTRPDRRQTHKTAPALQHTSAASSPPHSQARVRVRPPWWRCRESNPGPPSPRQGFSVRSPLRLYLDPPVMRTSRCDDPSRCGCPVQAPRPGLAVSPLTDAGVRGGDTPGPTDVTPRSGGEGNVTLTNVGAYLCAMTLTVVSRLHRHASH